MEEALAAFTALQLTAAAQELRACNPISARFGLALSEGEIEELSQRRIAALHDTGRVEFGGGILKKLVLALCDSPYLQQENYAQTLDELQEAFYRLKNESTDTIPDDELIECMANVYNGRAQGAAEYLAQMPLEELLRGDGRGGAGEELFWELTD